MVEFPNYSESYCDGTYYHICGIFINEKFYSLFRLCPCLTALKWFKLVSDFKRLTYLFSLFFLSCFSFVPNVAKQKQEKQIIPGESSLTDKASDGYVVESTYGNEMWWNLPMESLSQHTFDKRTDLHFHTLNRFQCFNVSLCSIW